MKEVTYEDYLEFIKTHKFVVIENVKLEIGKKWPIKELQPRNFKPETTTVWSFPDRGNWATHYLNVKYRGNWAPQIPRNLILKYTQIGDTVLDQMVGSGTTAIECKLLGRNCIAVDINPDAIMVTRDRLNFSFNTLTPGFPKVTIKTYVGDARNLKFIEDESIDLVATHPPYLNIISYSNNKIEGDLSKIKNVNEFIEEMKKIAQESFRVLKLGKHCAILMGDTRMHGHYIPIAFRVMQVFLEVGFILKEDIIKLQWHMKSTREKWGGRYDFYKIAHEHLFVFRKPGKGEKPNKFKESTKWW
ncbi:MAG: DNA methyltransferase [Candidatus Aenigmatarchaeota archaeon]|jgi:DNA modification methylase